MRPSDALRAEAAGAEYVGVILSAGFGRSVTPADARAIVAGLGIERVAVLVDEDEDAATRLGEALDASVLQLHGQEPPEVVAALRERGPWRIWKSVRARGAADVLRTLERYRGLLDGILVEGHREGVVGGGGVRLDLDAIVEVRGSIPLDLEVVLAGGLTPETVADAVARFAPDVVDVSSGVERARGEKAPDLVRRFVRAVRHGDPGAHPTRRSKPRSTPGTSRRQP